MGFVAKNFSFDRIPCTEYGLRIFDIGDNNNEAAPFASTGVIQNDVIPSSGRSFLYGRTFSSPLEFKLVFGLDPCMIESDEYLDRFEMDAIANWLTGHNTYKWLDIEQPDMEILRYHCIISELQPIQIAWLPLAFTAKIVCDSPYGYILPQRFKFNCSGTTNVNLVSRSTLNRWYYPQLDITLNGSNTISITNQSCDNINLSFVELPKNYFITISIDNELGVIKSSDSAYSNLYRYCNFKWLPLRRGMNKLVVKGNCILDFKCEFPVNCGG